MKTQVGAIIVYVCVLSLAVTLCAIAQENPPAQVDSTTKEKILRKAYQYTGFNALEGFSDCVVDGPRPVEDESDNTPYLHRYWTEGKVWVVAFRNIVITEEEAKVDSSHEFSRDFSVYLDGESGKLLKIQSSIPEIRWPYIPAGTLEERETHWRKAGVLSVSLPDEMPVAFSDVLAKCPHRPYVAAEVVALYVTKTYKGSVRLPTRWEVYLWGVPPIPSPGPVPSPGLGADEILPEDLSSIIVYSNPVTGEPSSGHAPAR